MIWGFLTISLLLLAMAWVNVQIARQNHRDWRELRKVAEELQAEQERVRAEYDANQFVASTMYGVETRLN